MGSHASADVPLVGFLTDYGLQDGFTAVCHGVIARIAPRARVVDITHLVPPGDIRHGGLVLAQTAPYLPATVLLAVVDPGVGTARRPVAVATADGPLLVGPDNGLLPPAADALGGAVAAHRLANADLLAARRSRTFHGRDVFAPVAAHLAVGTPITAVGPALDVAGLVRLPAPHARVSSHVAEAEVLTVDHFGNVQTSLRADQVTPQVLHGLGTRLVVCGSGGSHPVAMGETFGDVAPGAAVVFTDSAGMIALAVNGGDAATTLGLRPGDRLVLRSAPDHELPAR